MVLGCENYGLFIGYSTAFMKWTAIARNSVGERQDVALMLCLSYTPWGDIQVGYRTGLIFELYNTF
jgi:hypothetical protein